MNKGGTVITNLIWRFAERSGAQLVAFIVSLVLARLLSPDAYGTIALITIFTTILQVFVDSGLGNSLIQKKDADNLDFSTVFYTNIVFCTVLYLIIFFCAPLISSFYKDLTLTPYIRVLSITVLISGVKNIQQAYVARNMLFKKFFFSTIGGTIVAGITGIVMALCGMGIWALVAQQVINLAIGTVILWITVKWRPERKFSFARLKQLYSFGWKLLVSAVIDTVYNDIRQLIIGRIYSSSDLAFYNQGKKFPNLIVTNINTSIDSVLLPALSREQDKKESVKNMTRKSIKVSVYIMAPLMIGLAVVAPQLVRVVLTEKWLPCVPFLRIFCIIYTFYPIHSANLNAIKAIGRSDLFLILEILKKVFGVTVMLITMRRGVLVMAYSFLLTSFVSQIINTWPNKKLLSYAYIDQIKDIFPSVLLACVMGLFVWLIEKICHMPAILILVFQVMVGVIVYLAGSKLFKFKEFNYILGLLKRNKNDI